MQIPCSLILSPCCADETRCREVLLFGMRASDEDGDGDRDRDEGTDKDRDIEM